MRSRLIDVGLAMGLSALLAFLQPAMPDGDGLTHAARAVEQGFAEGMAPKHPLYAAVLRGAHLAAEGAGRRGETIAAMCLVSHLATAGSYLLLAWAIYPVFLDCSAAIRICALGATLSYGLLAAGSTIEAYALAAFLNLAVVALCVRGEFSRRWTAVALGLTGALAYGIHVTSVLTAPLALGVLIARLRGRELLSAAGLAAASAGLGWVLMASAMTYGRYGAFWPLAASAVLPEADVEPALGAAGRLSRAAYGIVRTVVWLPPFRDADRRTLAGVGAGAALGLAFLAFVASRGLGARLRRRPADLAWFALAAAPFTAMGMAYYPSDPERWLFLLPLVWLAVGLAVCEYRPPEGARVGRSLAVWGVAALVACIGAYNAAAKLYPESRGDRRLAGLQTLSRTASAGDLVVCPSTLKGPILEFFPTGPLEFDEAAIERLVERRGDDAEAVYAELRSRIDRTLGSGRDVYAFDLFNEGHEAMRGSPWSRFSNPRYAPEAFLKALSEYSPEPIHPPSAERCGIYQLRSD